MKSFIKYFYKHNKYFNSKQNLQFAMLLRIFQGQFSRYDLNECKEAIIKSPVIGSVNNSGKLHSTTIWHFSRFTTQQHHDTSKRILQMREGERENAPHGVTHITRDSRRFTRAENQFSRRSHIYTRARDTNYHYHYRNGSSSAVCGVQAHAYARCRLSIIIN